VDDLATAAQRIATSRLRLEAAHTVSEQTGDVLGDIDAALESARLVQRLRGPCPRLRGPRLRALTHGGGCGLLLRPDERDR
jgi:hypothetical protein